MQIQVNRRYSDYATYFPQNSEEISYSIFPEQLNLSVQANQLTSIIPYSTYTSKTEYFLIFKINPFLLQTENFRKINLFRRTASLILPIGEVVYHYHYTKNYLHSNFVKNISSLLVANKLVVQIQTQSNVSLPKNNESLLCFSDHNVVVEHAHAAEKRFSSVLTNFFIDQRRVNTSVDCNDSSQEDILKNYTEVKKLNN